MRTSRRGPSLRALRIIAAATVSGGAYAVYLMACASPTAPPPSLVVPTPLNGIVGSTYGEQFMATGGKPPYAFTLHSAPATLPPGLSFSPAGLLSGSPTAAGTYTPTMLVSDQFHHSSFKTVSITIALEITPASLPGGMSGTSYNQQLAAVGGTSPYNWAIPAGALPPGLSLSTGGLLSGTPAGSGTFAFTAQASDAASDTGQLAYSLTIAQGGCTITPATLPVATLGQSYSVVLTASTACYSVALPTHSQWSVVGSLPNGFTLSPPSGSGTTTLSSTGLVQGTPASYGFSIMFQGVDTGPPVSGQNVTQSYSLVISP